MSYLFTAQKELLIVSCQLENVGSPFGHITGQTSVSVLKDDEPESLE